MLNTSIQEKYSTYNIWSTPKIKSSALLSIHFWGTICYHVWCEKCNTCSPGQQWSSTLKRNCTKNQPDIEVETEYGISDNRTWSQLQQLSAHSSWWCVSASVIKQSLCRTTCDRFSVSVQCNRMDFTQWLSHSSVLLWWDVTVCVKYLFMCLTCLMKRTETDEFNGLCRDQRFVLTSDQSSDLWDKQDIMRLMSLSWRSWLTNTVKTQPATAQQTLRHIIRQYETHYETHYMCAVCRLLKPVKAQFYSNPKHFLAVFCFRHIFTWNH